MNVVENDVRILVDKELAAANERFPQFHSQHEGYAVILEELEETKESLCNMELTLKQAWGHIKDNRSARFELVLAGLVAQNAACEAIQVAAMCRKFMEMEEEKK